MGILKPLIRHSFIAGFFVICFTSFSSEQEETLNYNEDLPKFADDVQRDTSASVSVIDIWRRSEQDFYIYYNNNTDKNGTDNCSSLQHPQPEYNSSCELVHSECRDKIQLFDYLSFVVCSLKKVQPLGYTLLILWLIYLISLLATTVDNFFVPPLTFLAEKLKLSPSIAGITVLALGNAAPDIFVVYSGLAQDDVALVLGSLMGGGMFVTTVVLGSIILFTNKKDYNIDKLDFMRDITAYMAVVGTVIAVAFDGKVYLIEACMFPLIYVIYLAVVISISYARSWRKNKSTAKVNGTDGEEVVHSEREEIQDGSQSLPPQYIARSIEDEKQRLLRGSEKSKLHLPGLAWPRGAHVVAKIIWVTQWPFSLLRWISIPPFCHDGSWSRWHFMFAVISPFPIGVLILIVVKRWNAFTMYAGKLPLPELFAAIGICISVILFLALSSKKPPHWSLQLILAPVAFGMAIIWLNIIANEVVSVLQALGLLFNIDTGILGLTVLAIGNSVADWVADIVVARRGKPEMAFASCFGSPLMGVVVGLSAALIIKILLNSGEAYSFYIHTPEYDQVKLSWIFLGISLLGSTIFFPVTRFSPPRLYGLVAILFYTIFVIFAVLAETNVLPVYF